MRTSRGITIPKYLEKYIVDQSSDKYSFIDHSCWRYILRKLVSHLTDNAHESYLDGVRKTGITIDKIPSIKHVDQQISKFGWSAVPVSGFLPPAAFMEFQALGVLPIASDMRSIEHMEYTPAPDIVHEAAGHAPILVNQDFANYLKAYAEAAKFAILSKEDLDVYEAIRILSDLKENPNALEDQIQTAMENLDRANKSVYFIPEGAYLARMYWWTAEYGMIGEISKPKIYGAGLLSSVGESYTCFDPKVKKIPLTSSCLEFNYDITEPQPQLFVARDFKDLFKVLNDFINTMAFKTGGIDGLTKIKKARSVNSVELNSGLQISGLLKDFLCSNNEVFYLQFSGPCQLSALFKELKNHGTNYHKDGFGSPIGLLKNSSKCLSEFSESDLKKFGININSKVELEYQSGILVAGKLTKIVKQNGKIILLTFTDCTVTKGNSILFNPSWGIYDMATGSKVTSVFGSAADREAFGMMDDFVVKKVDVAPLMGKKKRLNDLYGEIRKIRESFSPHPELNYKLEQIVRELIDEFSEDWLLKVEILEILKTHSLHKDLEVFLEDHLQKVAQSNSKLSKSILDGIELIGFKPPVN